MAGKSDEPPISQEQMEALPSEFRALLQSVIDFYEARLVEQDKRLAEQDKRIAELEVQLKRTSRNSSKPPSGSHPHDKPKSDAGSDANKKKRNRGGQPGHPKHERELVPVEDVDQLHTLKPETCRGCGHALAGQDPEPLRHQMWPVFFCSLRSTLPSSRSWQSINVID